MSSLIFQALFPNFMTFVTDLCRTQAVSSRRGDEGDVVDSVLC